VIRVRRFAAVVSLVACGALTGCGSFSLEFVNLLARFGSYDVQRDVAYGQSPEQRLDAYHPSGARGAPMVVFFYGGSWRSGSKSEYLFVAQALTSRGFVAVVPDYRKFPGVKFPDFVRDGAAVVAWTRANAERLGGDPEALFVMGHSAGAHIAALLALDPSYVQEVGGDAGWLRGMIGLAGPYDFNARREDLAEIFEGAPYDSTQPLSYAASAKLPLLLLHGEADRTVFKKNTVNLAAAITRAGGDARTHFYDETDHSGIVAALSIPLRGSSAVLDDIADFVGSVSGHESSVGE